MAEHHPFEQQLAQAWAPPSWRDVTVVVAVSGGADSVALLCALNAISQQTCGRLVAAHFNHLLRDSESAGDERFVQQICRQLGVECSVGKARSVISSAGDGLEAEARQQRYQFFRDVADCQGARYVVTAHTADDQAETILHRVIRGTGLVGLGGIPPTRPLSEFTTIVRPMLSVSRCSVVSYLESLCQPFREDSSNKLTVFTRNRIRHRLMPLLAEQYNPQVASSLVRLGNLAREAQQVVDAAVEPLLEMAVTLRTQERVELVRARLFNSSPFLVREVFLRIWKMQRWPRQDMSEAKWNQLSDLTRAERPSPSTSTLPGNIQVEVRDDAIILVRL